MSALATKLITAEEFMTMPEPADGSKQELVRGEIETMPPTKGRHGYAQLNIGILLGVFVKSNGLGWVVTESGVVIERDPDTVRGPDVSFYSIGRHPDPPGEYFDIPPDMVVEIRSPSDRPGRLQTKLRQYADNGVRLIWVADPADRTVTVYSGKKRGVVHEDDDQLDGGDVLPNFTCKVADCFV